MRRTQVFGMEMHATRPLLALGLLTGGVQIHQVCMRSERVL